MHQRTTTFVVSRRRISIIYSLLEIGLIPNTQHALLACVPVLSELYWTWLPYVTFWKGFLITINQIMYSRCHARFGKKRQICLSVMEYNSGILTLTISTLKQHQRFDERLNIVAQKSNRYLGSGKKSKLNNFSNAYTSRLLSKLLKLWLSLQLLCHVLSNNKRHENGQCYPL